MEYSKESVIYRAFGGAAAVQSALFSLHGMNIEAQEGINASTPVQTMKNVGELSTMGMIETDRTILKILIERSFSVPSTDRRGSPAR